MLLNCVMMIDASGLFGNTGIIFLADSWSDKSANVFLI